MKKQIWTFVTALVVGLYTTFVLKSLWNWFAVKALNVQSVSYWEMYGIMMLLSLLLFQDDHFKQDQQWKASLIILDACVPEGMREIVEDQLKSHGDDAWVNVGMQVFGKAISNTITLVLGWLVYTFFVS